MTESIYEIFTPLTVERKQHFWEWFVGDTIKNCWTKNALFGTSIGAMCSNIDGGFKSAWSVDSVNTTYTFNDVRHYSETGSVWITTTKRTTAGQIIVGLSSTDRHNTQYNSYQDSTSGTFKTLINRNGSCTTTTNTSVCVDTNWTSAKGELTCAASMIWIGNTLEGTSTTNLPTVVMQPIFQHVAISSSNVDISMRYFEVYNT